MSIELFDEVVLKDGRKGTVTELLDRDHFLLDIGYEKWESIEISLDDVQSVMHVQK